MKPKKKDNLNPPFLKQQEKKKIKKKKKITLETFSQSSCF